MRLPKRWVLLAVLLLVMVPLSLPGTGRAGDDNDNDNSKKKSDKPESSRQLNDTPESGKPTASPRSIVPAGAAPDLELTYRGFKSPDNRQVIAFMVKNLGTGPSSVTTKVRVVTSTPEPTPHFREIPLPPKDGTLKPGESAVLNPGESVEVIYSLAADCNGHLVRALVSDPLDTNSANNSVEQLVCPAPPPPAPAPPGPPSAPENDGSVVVGPAPNMTPLAERLRPGEHTLEFPANIRRGHGIQRVDRFFLDACISESGASVGNIGFHFEDQDGCEINLVRQFVVNFDLRWLKDLKQKLIYRAELLYDEVLLDAPDARTVVVGNVTIATCVGRLGLAPANWPEILARTDSRDSLTPALLTTQDNSGERLLGGWDVTEEIQFASRPDTQSNGFVLHSVDEDLYAERDAACLSTVRNFRLKLHYAVL